MVAVGVDACKTGWIAVVLDEGGPVAHYLPTIGALTSVVRDPTAIGIDMPIGLPEGGRRASDLEARRFLGPRRNSIFFTPSQAAVEAANHAAATALSKELTGMGISRQSYALAEKILQVQDWLPSAPCVVREVHPEVSFALLIGQPARASKKTWAGMVQRRDVLAAAGIQLDRVSSEAGERAAVDDMLDAGAVAWSANRLLLGTARSFPDPPYVDRLGRSMAIWA